MDSETILPPEPIIPKIQIFESPGPTTNYVAKRNKMKKNFRHKQRSGLYTEDSVSDGYSTDDGSLVSPRVLKKTNVKKEGFDDFIKRRRNELERQRSSISLYTSPVLVMTYFIAYIIQQGKSTFEYVQSRKWVLSSIPALGILIQFALLVEGSHQEMIYHAQASIFWYCYWIGLGIASSIGLGTGLHTFLLFLGPHIAEVTWVAYKCGNLNFETHETTVTISLMSIFHKVLWESFFWGLGTALGELPPYFVARAAALSGSRGEELKHIDALLEQSPESISYKERILIFIHRLMKRLGFFGIFLFASIPNPLFDLAGVICGQFLVPFSTFFGATFLGKAVVKSSIQTIFVILLFSQDTIDTLLDLTHRYIPYLYDILQVTVQRQTKMLKGGEMDISDLVPGSPSYISIIWNTLFNLMLAYFALSIIETFAVSYLKRVHDQEIEALEQKAKEKASNDGEDNSLNLSQMSKSMIETEQKCERDLGRGYSSD
ncbi:16875_t:CDS:2 [Acaulospora morrowiae]|uniref:16875_t:CDS:1 n=1 Tax=Acaulospora morrowiae TaxID=94023 RepID=A0A9N8ZIW5_9GLOM|nr:16875_t:CDS:2 [Acaulospora morrowiae]